MQQNYIVHVRMRVKMWYVLMNALYVNNIFLFLLHDFLVYVHTLK